MLIPNNKIFADKEDLFKNILFLSANILFIYLFLMSGYYNRFAADDFAYYFRVRDMGIWDAFIFAYKTWNTRWASILFMNVMMKFFSPENSLLLYYVLILGLFFISVYRMLKAFFSFLIIEMNSFLIANYNLLFISGFFLFTFGIDETWFWMNASTIYIFPVIMLCLGVSYILSPRNNFFTHLMLNISFLIAGGGNEPFAIIIIYLLFMVLIYQIKPLSFIIQNHPRRIHLSKIKAAILIIISSFLINAYCPGVAIRQSFLPPADFVHIIGSIGFTILNISKIIVLEKLIFILPFTLLWMYLGNLFKRKDYELNFDMKTVIKYVTLGLISVSLFTIIVSSIMLHGVPPMRAMTVISFFMTIGFSIIGFFIGYNYFAKPITRYSFYLASIVMIVSLSIIIFHQYPIIKAHADAYDQRIIALKTLESNHTFLSQKVAPLPPSGWLYHGDISPDTLNIQNAYFKNSLGLHFNVSVDSSKTY